MKTRPEVPAPFIPSPTSMRVYAALPVRLGLHMFSPDTSCKVPTLLGCPALVGWGGGWRHECMAIFLTCELSQWQRRGVFFFNEARRFLQELGSRQRSDHDR